MRNKPITTATVGERYGRLTIIEIAEPHIQPSGKRMQMRLCRCECGNEITVAAQSLRNGRTKSCGCLRSERSKEIHRSNAYSDTRLHAIWCKMRQRCEDKNNPNYIRWGGRGIYVCDAWQSFDEFYAWSVTHGYSDGLSIDRIDNNGPYCPENCRWADNKAQANNRRSNRIISINGVTKTLSQWAEMSDVLYSTISARLKRGWSPERALYAPVRGTKERVTTTVSPTVSSATSAHTTATTTQSNS